MAKWIKNILGIVIAALLIWYLGKHWDKLSALLKLGPVELFAIYFITFLSMLSNSYIVVVLLKVLRVRTRFWDMVLLQNATTLLNYLPMKFGTIFRANYLKRHYGLSYAHFGTFFVYLTLLITAATAVAGVTVLLLVYGVTGYEAKLVAGVFLSAFVCSIFLAFMPLPMPKGSNKVSAVLRNFLIGRGRVKTDKRALIYGGVFLIINLILYSVRLGVIYNSMGQNIHPAGFLILGALGYFILFLGLTPGSLGIRELLLGSGAVVLGLTLEVGILAALIDRAIMLSWSFVVGSACTIWLWHKSPSDFNQTKRDSIKSSCNQIDT